MWISELKPDALTTGLGGTEGHDSRTVPVVDMRVVRVLTCLQPCAEQLDERIMNLQKRT